MHSLYNLAVIYTQNLLYILLLIQWLYVEDLSSKL